MRSAAKYTLLMQTQVHLAISSTPMSTYTRKARSPRNLRRRRRRRCQVHIRAADSESPLRVNDLFEEDQNRRACLHSNKHTSNRELRENQRSRAWFLSVGFGKLLDTSKCDLKNTLSAILRERTSGHGTLQLMVHSVVDNNNDVQRAQVNVEITIRRSKVDIVKEQDAIKTNSDSWSKSVDAILSRNDHFRIFSHIRETLTRTGEGTTLFWLCHAPILLRTDSELPFTFATP